MKIKLILPAIALAFLPCLPAKADWGVAGFTKQGNLIEVETDSIIRYEDGTRKFISRIRQFSTILGADVALVDCFYPQIMFISRYNPQSKSWIDHSNPQWQTIKENSPTASVGLFVCGQP
jgi:hypothetical protein